MFTVILILFCRTNGTMAKETSVKKTTPAVPPPETKPSPPTTLFGKFYPTDPHVPRVWSQSLPPPPPMFSFDYFICTEREGVGVPRLLSRFDTYPGWTPVVQSLRS